MVKLYSLLFMLAIPLALFCEDVKVTAGIDQEGVIGMTMKGTITVTHDKSLKVDTDSFKIGKESLKVEFLKEIRISSESPLVITLYNFSITPTQSGLQNLPEISVLVGNKVYRSFTTTYKVDEQKATSTPSSGESSVVLKFENIVDGKTILYPGQRLRVGYRFIFNYSIDLTKEEVPLLDAKGFQKIGGKEAKDFTQDNLNYLEATQVIQAIEPGEYQFKPGLIQGRAYTLNRLGKKELADTENRSETDPLTITVLPFPENGKPTSFNGAVGDAFSFTTTLLTPGEMTVGDKITLLIKISGERDPATVPMPEVCCQPGYSGFFRLSDLPPTEETTDKTKTFKVEMRPLTALIKEIPALEFSYFNPEKESYISLRSDPIPIKVSLLSTNGEEELTAPINEKQEILDEHPGEARYHSEAIEIEGVVLLTSQDLENKTFGTWWTLLIIPLGIGALFLQIHMRRFMLEKKRHIKLKQSQELFQEAFHQKPGTPPFFHLLQEAFLLRLVERGDIASTETPPEKIPDQGPAGEVRAFLHLIEEKRFGGKEEVPEKLFLEKAKHLFEELKS